MENGGNWYMGRDLNLKQAPFSLLYTTNKCIFKQIKADLICENVKETSNAKCFINNLYDFEFYTRLFLLWQWRELLHTNRKYD